ncbi:MAG: hypothetical protein ACRC46_08830 [Thermoguttaceae bacterium]
MRLVTRADFDGLVCGALLAEQGLVDDIVFVHPKDLQDGYFRAESRDVLCNVPFVEGCAMWFDHHASELQRVGVEKSSHGESRHADSCARIIYDYYGGAEAYPWANELIEAVDRVDSGKLTPSDVLNPQGWVLIGFLTDPRTGLGRFQQFGTSSYQLMLRFIRELYKLPVNEILQLPDVSERVKFYHSESDAFQEMVRTHTRTVDNVIVTDLRGVDVIHASNRFVIYGMYPDQNVSLWVTPTKGNIANMLACGYSVINRSCTADVGSLMAKHGGGGHRQVGTCQIVRAETDAVLEDVIKNLRGT